MMPHPYATKIRGHDVLVLEEDNMWCAVAMSFRVRGYGDTPKEAVAALDVHLTAAEEDGIMDNIRIQADPHYIRLHNAVSKGGIR